MWLYQARKWIRIENIQGYAYLDPGDGGNAIAISRGEADHDPMLYGRIHTFGYDTTVALKIYKRTLPDMEFPYFVEVVFSLDTEGVLIADFPNLLLFLKEYQVLGVLGGYELEIALKSIEHEWASTEREKGEGIHRKGTLIIGEKE
jgi:hypothetical protein